MTKPLCDRVSVKKHGAHTALNGGESWCESHAGVCVTVTLHLAPCGVIVV